MLSTPQATACASLAQRCLLLIDLVQHSPSESVLIRLMHDKISCMRVSWGIDWAQCPVSTSALYEEAMVIKCV